MTVTIQWLLQDHIILIKSVGDMSVDDLLTLDAEILRLLDGPGEHPIHLLVDDSKQTSIPGIRAMSRLKHIRHPRLGWFVASAPHPIFKMIGTVIGTSYNLKVKYVDTMDGGLTFLAEQDLYLPPAADLVRLRCEAVA